MSLDWKATEIPEHLRNWNTRSPDGKEDIQMHPLMHRIIWLTMVLGGSPSDLTEKELERRLAVINRLDPEMLEVRFGGDLKEYRVYWGHDEGEPEWLTLEEYCHRLHIPYVTYLDEVQPRPTMYLTPEVIHLLYGTLWTNADRRPFATWQRKYCESVLRDSVRTLKDATTHRYKLQGEQYRERHPEPEADPHNAPSL